MKSSEKLEFLFRGGKTDVPVNDPIKEVWLGNLKPVGAVTRNVKKPEDAVEIVFWSKETKTSIYFVGDTAFWGDKQFNSVKLTRDSMWKQVVGMVQPAPPKPDDTAGLKAAIEAADSIEATRVGDETDSLKKTVTLKKEDVKEFGKFALVTGKPSSHYGKDEPDAIDIVVKTGKDSTKFRLIGDTLVFDKDRSIKMESNVLWMKLFYKLQKRIGSDK